MRGIAPELLIALPEMTNDDRAAIAQCDSGVRVRRLIERAIVRKTAQALIAAGWHITIDNGGDDDEDIHCDQNIDKVMAECMATDEEHFLLSKTPGKPSDTYAGVVFFVYGNSGHDVMSNWTTNLEADLKPANDYADQLAEWC